MKKNKKIVVFFPLMFLFIIAAVYSFPKLQLIKQYRSINITALATKEDASEGCEVWINSIKIGNEYYDLSKIKHDNNWIYKDSNLVFIGNNPSSITIKYNSALDLTVGFNKHSYSGLVSINNKKSDIFSLYSKEYEVFEYNSFKKSFSLLYLFLNTIVYMIIFIIIFLLIRKKKITYDYIPIFIYIFLSFLLTNSFTKYLLVLAPMFFSYFIIFKKYKENLLFTVIPLLIFFISRAFISPLNLNYGIYSSYISYLFVNIGFVSLMHYLVYFVYNFYIKIKSSDIFYKRWLKYSVIYIIINIIILLLIWPGNWIWDEKGIFYCAQNYYYNNWQSYLMVLFYSWSLMLCPFIVGIVINQILIISFIFGYILSRIKEIFKSEKFILTIYVLLSLPPIILNIQYPLRAAMYSSLELLFLFNIYYFWKSKKELNNYNLLALSLLIVVLAFWRSEGIYYLFLGPIIIYLIFKPHFKIKKNIFVFICCLCISLGLYIPFKILEKNNPNNYILTIFANPLSMMLQDDINISSEELNDINNVYDVDVLKKYPAYNETPALNYNAIRPKYFEHMKSFLVSYVKIILKNPISYLSARTKTFLATSGFDKQYINNSPWSFYDEEFHGENVEIENMVNNDRFSKPFNYEFRNKVISFLKGADIKTDKFLLYGQIIWNFMPMLIAIAFLAIQSLIRKKYTIFILSAMSLVKVPIVFLTAPANYFFYYYSIYLIGSFVIGYYIYKLLWRNKYES